MVKYKEEDADFWDDVLAKGYHLFVTRDNTAQPVTFVFKKG